MTRVRADRPSGGAKRTRAGVAVAASTLLHLVVLTELVMTLRKPAPPALLPSMEVTLMRPSALPSPPRPRPPAARPAQVQAPRATTEPVPQAPASVERAQPLAQPPTPSLPARTPGDAVQFYQQHIPGCGREDLILMTPEEQDYCRARIAAAAAAGRRALRAEDRKNGPLLAIPPDKRAEYEAVLAARRNKAPQSEALLGEIFANRAGGVNTNVDVNVHMKCSSAFSAGADGIKFGKLKCPNGLPK